MDSVPESQTKSGLLLSSICSSRETIDSVQFGLTLIFPHLHFNVAQPPTSPSVKTKTLAKKPHKKSISPPWAAKPSNFHADMMQGITKVSQMANMKNRNSSYAFSTLESLPDELFIMIYDRVSEAETFASFVLACPKAFRLLMAKSPQEAALDICGREHAQDVKKLLISHQHSLKHNFNKRDVDHLKHSSDELLLALPLATEMSAVTRLLTTIDKIRKLSEKCLSKFVQWLHSSLSYIQNRVCILPNTLAFSDTERKRVKRALWHAQICANILKRKELRDFTASIFANPKIGHTKAVLQQYCQLIPHHVMWELESVLDFLRYKEQSAILQGIMDVLKEVRVSVNIRQELIVCLRRKCDPFASDRACLPSPTWYALLSHADAGCCRLPFNATLRRMGFAFWDNDRLLQIGFHTYYAWYIESRLKELRQDFDGEFRRVQLSKGAREMIHRNFERTWLQILNFKDRLDSEFEQALGEQREFNPEARCMQVSANKVVDTWRPSAMEAAFF